MHRFAIPALVAGTFVTLMAFGLWVHSATAQVANPANQQKPDDTPQIERARLRSWELPPVTVYGLRPSKYREEDRVGEYAQPRWTARRRFAETRVYVISQGQFEVEYWLVPTLNKDNTTSIKKQYEAEFGLPHRVQLDLYVVSHQSGNVGPLAVDEEKFEMRYALANWGKLPANPTLYLEWSAENLAPDHVEGKLLLGGEIVPRWHWGTNLVFEHEAGGSQENSKELTGAVSYTVSDEILSLGVEGKFAMVDALEQAKNKIVRGKSSHELLLGPSLQYRPLPQMHIDLSPLLGVTDDAPKGEAMLVLGWEL